MRLFSALFLGSLTILTSVKAQSAYHQRAYKGARLSLTEIVAKKKGNQVSFEFTAINTGRQALLLKKGQAAGDDLVIDFDNSLDLTGSTRLQSTIASAILAGEWSAELPAGVTRKAQFLKVNIEKYPAFEVQPARNPTPSTTVKKDSAAVAVIPVKPSTAPDGLKNTNAKTPLPNSPPTAQKEPTPTVAAKTEGTETKAPVSSSSSESPPTKEGGLGKVTDARFADGCADLMVEQILLKKRTKKSVEITLILLNKGNKKAIIYSKDKKSPQRLAIKAQLNATDQLTRGALVLGGAFIEDGLEKSDGFLLPGHTLEIPLKFNVSDATKFTPYLILSLDVYQLVDECDESNNNQGIRIAQ